MRHSPPKQDSKYLYSERNSDYLYEGKKKLFYIILFVIFTKK